MLKMFVWVLRGNNDYILELLMSIKFLIFLVITSLRGMLASFLVAVIKLPTKAIIEGKSSTGTGKAWEQEWEGVGHSSPDRKQREMMLHHSSLSSEAER